MTQEEFFIMVVIFGIWALYLMLLFHSLIRLLRKVDKFDQDQNRIKQRLTVAKDRDDRMFREMHEIRSSIKKALKKK